MGLDILGEHSEYEYSYGYSALHRVRKLAYLYMGVPKALVETMNSVNQKEDVYDINNFQRMHDLSVEKLKITPDDLYNILLVGYHFPNLLFHSDCEGTYTTIGKVMETDDWLTGNIYELNKELTILKDYFVEHADKIDAVTLSDCTILNCLQKLVADECTFEEPSINFH